MIVDSSALIAILRREPEADALEDALMSAERLRISAGTLLEARIVAEGYGGGEDLAELLALVAIEVVPVDERLVDVAIEGFRRYGKGRHPARLNYGDCFAWALATMLREPLLFKGDDFAQTDVESALESRRRV
ncbi:MAG: type II toxin-antitoxin system VapC family toxin [Myxococcales bacterium]|nr:type II toxin-antitoxin system VapC family toxin [Myxococcales bacterium]MCB9734261.1 type II toxin-antitoxin system VapC family toxin [Deltaproteobacteria bacterium]